MVTIIQIQRYAWVVELLLRRKSLSIREINDAWSRSSLVEFPDEKMNRKSWYKCFDDICIIYGIIIEGEKKGGLSRWHIMNPEFLQENNVEAWMLACMAHRNLLVECLGMYHRVDIEGFPSENGMLKHIALAMKEKRKMEITYRRYGHSQPKEYVVEPYFIKTYNHRFYVVCKSEKGDFLIFSFDRILSTKMLVEHFVYPSELSAQEFFDESFGVMIPPEDVKAQKIVIRAKGDAGYYLQDVPLHKSQKLIGQGDGYADFSIRIKPTDDFIGAILQQADRLEIISPKEVRKRIKDKLKDTLKAYE